MSYQIIYDSFAIRLPKSNRYLPMVLMGSSNLRDARTNRRCRDWYCWAPDGSKTYSEYELRQSVESFKESLIQSNKEYQNNYPHWSDYEDKSFGWFAGIAVRGSHTSKTTYNMFKNMFNLKKVVDIDEYLKTFSLKIEKLGSAQYINSEDDLFECLSDSEGQWISTSVHNRWSSGEVLKLIDPNLLPQKKEPRQKKEVVQDHYYTIMYESWYLKKVTKRYIRYNQTHPVLKFRTEKEAQRKLRTLDERFRIEKINKTQTFYV